MRFHLIDKLLSYNEWESATSIKNLTLGTPEFINCNHYMDDSLLMECIFQCAAWLIVISSKQKYRPTIVTAEKFKIYKHIKVGKQITIHASIKERFDDYVTICGEILCEEQQCASLENAILKLVDTEQLEDKKLTEKYIKYLTS